MEKSYCMLGNNGTIFSKYQGKKFLNLELLSQSNHDSAVTL